MQKIFDRSDKSELQKLHFFRTYCRLHENIFLIYDNLYSSIDFTFKRIKKMENIISQYDSEKTICKMLNECSKCRDYMVKNCICETDSKILKFLIDAYVCLELVTEQKKILFFKIM